MSNFESFYLNIYSFKKPNKNNKRYIEKWLLNEEKYLNKIIKRGKFQLCKICSQNIRKGIPKINKDQTYCQYCFHDVITNREGRETILSSVAKLRKKNKRIIMKYQKMIN